MITYYSHYKNFITKLLSVIDRNLSEEIIDVIVKSIIKKGLVDLSLNLPSHERIDFLQKVASNPDKADSLIQTLFSEQTINIAFQEAGIFILQNYFDESTPLTDSQLQTLNQVVAA